MKTYNPVKLMQGRSYITRNGTKVENIKLADTGTNYKFEAKIFDKRFDQLVIAAWRDDGVFLAVNVPHELDIVSEDK